MANFSLAVTTQHTLHTLHTLYTQHTCSAHKLRIRRVDQPASLNIYFCVSFCCCCFALPGPDSWAIHHFSWRWHFHLFQQTNKQQQQQGQRQRQQTCCKVDKSIFYSHTPRPLWPHVLPFLWCWLRAVKFISFNINWQHENLFINCSFICICM